MTYVAVDVDGTLTHSNVSFAFGRFLYRKGVISFAHACMPAFFYLAHSLGCISIERLHRFIFQTLFLGRPKDQIEKCVDVFLDLHGQQLLRPSIREEIAVLRQQGARLALLSSSPDFLVEKVARMLAIQEWVATEYVVDTTGVFASIGRIVTGEVKAQIVREIKRRDGVAIIAMTDSMLDMPLLEEADEVVAVYPDRRLKSVAAQRGWRIVNSG